MLINQKIILFVYLFVLFDSVYSEKKIIKESNLPFYLDEEKKLDENELKNKREGWYPTVLPIISSDPVRGNGLGIRAFLFNNGKQSSPLFEYQPYVYKIGAQVFKSSGRAESHGIFFDSPFLFGTEYRFKASLTYDHNPNTQYFGLGESSMKTLNYRSKNSPSGELHTNAQFSEREEALSYRRNSNSHNAFDFENDINYNAYDFHSTTLSVMLDKTFNGAFRYLIAPEFSQNIIKTYDYKYDSIKKQNVRVSNSKDFLTDWESSTPNGKTKLTEDFENKGITGLKGGHVNYLRVGLIYDTRDFEPDPDRGMVAEINYSKVGKLTASDYEYSKTFMQMKYFKMPFPNFFEELVVSTRALVNYTKGDSPFSEYRYMWSADGPINGLGGLQTLRGYRQERFVGPVMGVANLEVRWRFATVKSVDELFTFSLVPFFDTGRVWDKPDNMSVRGYARSYGMGLRIVWNQATIILLDYAKSREGSQVFLDFNQIF